MTDPNDTALPAPAGRRMNRAHLAGLAASCAVAAIAVAGCGSSGSAAAKARTATTPAPTATATASGRTLKVTTTEFAFDPMTATAPAGKLKLTLVNAGKVPHEMVLLKTGQAAGALSVKAGRVSEAASVGEVSETPAGATKSTTLNLKRGSYVFVCNIPGHYADGMRGTLTVR
jgi:uncharacterized cupredoxin-like copper-binding protein